MATVEEDTESIMVEEDVVAGEVAGEVSMDLIAPRLIAATLPSLQYNRCEWFVFAMIESPLFNKISLYIFLLIVFSDMIFNPDSLCIDTFIRSYMDEEGFVPIMLTMQYQNVAAMQCSYYDVFNKLKECIGKTKHLELDPVNECVRLREGWEKVSYQTHFLTFLFLNSLMFQFLMPNPYGGRGLPRYRKQNPNPMSQTHNHYGQQHTEAAVAAPTTA